MSDDASHLFFLSSSSSQIIQLTHITILLSLSSALLEKIADLVNDKKLEGISDLRDESDRDGIRVVVELKRDAVPALVQNNLFKKTSLQWAFSGDRAALVSSSNLHYSSSKIAPYRCYYVVHSSLPYFINLSHYLPIRLLCVQGTCSPLWTTESSLRESH